MKSQTVRICTKFLVLTAFVIGMAAPALANTDGEKSLVFVDLFIKDHPDTKTTDYSAGVQEIMGLLQDKFLVLERADSLKLIGKEKVSSARQVNDSRLREIEKLVNKGDKLLYTNRQKAIEVLREANAKLQGLSDSFQLDTKIRNYSFRTKMLLIESHMHNKNASKARSIMSEVIRRFEISKLQEINDDNYHPRTVKLYKEVHRALESQRTAQLTVTTTPPGCEVFINGQAQKNPSPYTFDRLYPGETMVQVQQGNMQSMATKVTLTADGATEIQIDLAYEATLSLSDKSLGLTFENLSTMKRDVGTYAGRLAREVEADFVAVTGVHSTTEGYVLAGMLFRAQDGKLIRKTAIPVKPNVVSRAVMRTMAAFLADVDANVGAEWYKNVYGWSLVGAGGISLGVSLAFVSKYLTHKEHAEDPNYKTKIAREQEASKAQDAQLLSGILAGVGSALIIGGALVFMFDTDDAQANADIDPLRPRFMAAPLILPDGGGFSATWRF